LRQKLTSFVGVGGVVALLEVEAHFAWTGTGSDVGRRTVAESSTVVVVGEVIGVGQRTKYCLTWLCDNNTQISIQLQINHIGQVAQH